MVFGSRLLTAVAGGVLLVAGRRVYWLLVGLVGFVLGFTFAAELLEGPEWVTLVAGLAAGLLASALAVFFQKIALGVAGFVIGGLAVLWWAEQMGWSEVPWVWVVALVVGVLGSLLTRTVFEVALIILSSVLGATFILEALQRPVDEMSALYLVLVVAGVVIQALFGRSRKRE